MAKAKREMFLGSAEMSPETAAIFSGREWSRIVRLVARYTAAWWTVNEMPKRWDRSYAQAYLGKRNVGNDGVPYFQLDVKSRNRRWIAMAKQSVITGGAGGAIGAKQIRATVRHPVPNVVRRSSLQSFSTIPNREAATLGSTVENAILEATKTTNIKRWGVAMMRRTKALHNRLIVVLGTAATRAEAAGRGYRRMGR